jgi:hypothetical protein
MITETSDPATIERELEQTRARLGGRLDELQAKLSPGQLLDEGLGYLRHSQGADFFRNLGESAAEKPLPLALVGIGLAWLVASGAGPRQPARHGVEADTVRHNGFDELTARVRNAGASVTRLPDETDEAYRLRVNMARGYALGLSRGDEEDSEAFATRIDGTLSDARQRMSDAASRISGAASHAQRRVSDAAQGLRDQASDMGDRLGASARAAGDSLSQGSDMARRAGSSVMSAMTDNPVLLGVFGLAAGALLGALMPQSDQEARALGDAASRAGDAMSDAANDAMERGSRVASAAMAAGQDAAREEGLMPDGADNRAD